MADVFFGAFFLLEMTLAVIWDQYSIAATALQDREGQLMALVQRRFAAEDAAEAEALAREERRRLRLEASHHAALERGESFAEVLPLASTASAKGAAAGAAAAAAAGKLDEGDDNADNVDPDELFRREQRAELLGGRRLSEVLDLALLRRRLDSRAFREAARLAREAREALRLQSKNSRYGAFKRQMTQSLIASGQGLVDAIKGGGTPTSSWRSGGDGANGGVLKYGLDRGLYALRSTARPDEPESAAARAARGPKGRGAAPSRLELISDSPSASPGGSMATGLVAAASTASAPSLLQRQLDGAAGVGSAALVSASTIGSPSNVARAITPRGVAGLGTRTAEAATAAASGDAASDGDNGDEEGGGAFDFWPELFGVDVPTRLQRLALGACCCCVRDAPEDEVEAVEAIGEADLAQSARVAGRDVLGPPTRALRCAVRYPRAPFYMLRRALESLSRAYTARVPPAPLWASALADAVIDSAPVRHFYTLLIVANSVALGFQYAGQSQAWADGLATANTVFVALFALEILLKMLADGLRGFFRDGFNAFDVVIVGVSLAGLVLAAGGSDGGGLGAGYTALRSLRVFRVFKLLRVWTSLRKLMAALVRGVRAALVSFALLLFVVFVFALLGMQAFGGGYDAIEATAASPWAASLGRQAAPKPQLNFDSLLWAMITVFEVMDNENWDVTVCTTASSPQLRG